LSEPVPPANPSAIPAATDIAAAPIPWIGKSPADSAEEAGARVLFTRVIARRNFSGFPFWVSCTPETCTLLAARAREYAAAAGFGAGVRLADLAPETIGLLRERMRLPERPATFPGKRDFKMIFAGRDGAEHALFGETEHWTQIRTLTGLPTAQETTFLLESQLAQEDERERTGGPEFSRSPGWGLLTSDPSFAGSGLQFEAGLHLPALTAARKMPQVQQAMAAMGFELQPLSLRDPGAAEAGYFRLLSRGGMDLTAEGLFGRFEGKTIRLLAAETSAWERWRTREPNLLEDRMHRALRLLQEARRMDLAELLFLTSFARAGAYAGIFPASLLPRLEELRIKARPFHVAALSSALSLASSPAFTPDGAARTATRPEQDADRENIQRAILARELLTGI
jgi:hypothetical protein